MKKLVSHVCILLVALLCATSSAIACTDFRLTAKDGTVFIARSMEFAEDLQSNLRTSTRGRQFTTVAPNNKPGLAWKAKYGYLYLDSFNQDFTLDGMNETGLSFEALYLPGEAEYQVVPAGSEAKGLSYLNIGDWILSNFQTAEEVRNALPSIFVFAQPLSSMGNIVFPLHFSVFDASGNGIVVEYIKGKLSIYNQIGVMTNSPTYDWQVTNLRNYLNLSPYAPNPVVAGNLVFVATGQGAGMVGLPGDVSPPSRFVKMSFMLKTSSVAATASDALNLVQHIINNVDIPAGISRAVSNGKESTETTQWVVFKDLSHKMFYYRTYHDMTIRSVSFSKLDFSDNAVRLKMPIAVTSPYQIDMSDQFIKAKAAQVAKQ